MKQQPQTKIFKNNKDVYQLNFVDSNNVVVGFCISTDDGREHFGYKISESICTTFEDVPELDPFCDFEPITYDGFVFDTGFFVENFYTDSDCTAVIFKLFNPTTNENLFLHLFNCHNGYYSHGFSMKLESEIIKEGKI